MGQGSAQLIDLLVRFNADINAVSKEGLTPLHCAILLGDIKSVEVLADLGADVNLKPPKVEKKRFRIINSTMVKETTNQTDATTVSTESEIPSSEILEAEVSESHPVVTSKPSKKSISSAKRFKYQYVVSPTEKSPSPMEMVEMMRRDASKIKDLNDPEVRGEVQDIEDMFDILELAGRRQKRMSKMSEQAKNRSS
jgi:ankyrin repeat protein